MMNMRGTRNNICMRNNEKIIKKYVKSIERHTLTVHLTNSNSEIQKAYMTETNYGNRLMQMNKLMQFRVGSNLKNKFSMVTVVLLDNMRSGNVHIVCLYAHYIYQRLRNLEWDIFAIFARKVVCDGDILTIRP